MNNPVWPPIFSKEAPSPLFWISSQRHLPSNGTMWGRLHPEVAPNIHQYLPQNWTNHRANVPQSLWPRNQSLEPRGQQVLRSHRCHGPSKRHNCPRNRTTYAVHVSSPGKEFDNPFLWSELNFSVPSNDARYEGTSGDSPSYCSGDLRFKGK